MAIISYMTGLIYWHSLHLCTLHVHLYRGLTDWPHVDWLPLTATACRHGLVWRAIQWAPLRAAPTR